MKSKDDLKLIKKVRKIFERSEFPFVSERIHFWVDDEDEQLTEIDVCAILGNKMFIVECKSGGLNNKNSELLRKKELIKAIKSKSVIKIKNDTKTKLTLDHLEDVDEVYLGYYLGDNTVYKNNIASLKSKEILVWDNNAVKYFEKVSETLGNLTQNEILFREFLVKDDDAGTKPIPSIKFKQGSTSLHLFTLSASQLLKISYVSRRGTSRDESYQRIINPNRLKSLNNFIIDSKNLIMANPIIIAFDQKIYGHVTYTDGKLNFKNIACSAWVIDGQHRIFAFKGIDLGSVKEKKYDIQIPIVALEKTDALLQSETFLNINYYQKKIDSLLIYDLAAHFKYPRNVLVWPSLLTLKLNESGVLKGLIKVKELEEKKPLQTTNFVRTLLEDLLGYNSTTDDYDGSLYNLSNFNKNTKIDSPKNQLAFKNHLDILQKYFVEVMNLTKKPGKNWKKEALARGFLTSSSIQAFMFVLSTILRSENKKNIDFKPLLKSLTNLNFTTGKYAEYRAGYPAIQGYTRDLLKTINADTGKNYQYIPISQIRKKLEKEKNELKSKVKSKVKR